MRTAICQDTAMRAHSLVGFCDWSDPHNVRVRRAEHQAPMRRTRGIYLVYNIRNQYEQSTGKKR